MAIATTAAILGAVGAGTNLLGGIFGAHAAKSAAQTLADSAAAAGKEVTDSVAATNPDVLNAAKTAGQGVIDASGQAVEGVNTAVTSANALLNPYATAGTDAEKTLAAGVAPGGDFNRAPTAADITIDPGYAFREQQSEQALERSAAAHGGVDNGGYLRDLNTFSQGNASQEYQKAFDRFTTSTQNRYNNVFGVANQGLSAINTQGSNLIGGAKYGGDTTIAGAKYNGDVNNQAVDLTTGRTIQGAQTDADYKTAGANATAAGKVAASNSIWGGVTGAANTAINTYGLSKIAPGGNIFNPASRLPNSRFSASPTMINGTNIFSPQQVAQ